MTEMTPNNFRVAVDIDDVTFDFSNTWRTMYCKEFNTVPTPKCDISGWDGPLTDTHFETFDEFFAWTTAAQVYESCPYIIGAEEGIDTLVSEGFDVWFVTARNGHAAEVTRQWHANHEWGDLTHLVTDAHDKTEPLADVYIDDKPETLLSAHAKGHGAICFLRPWNDSARKWPQGPPWEIRVANDWMKIVDHVFEEYELWMDLDPS